MFLNNIIKNSFIYITDNPMYINKNNSNIDKSEYNKIIKI